MQQAKTGDLVTVYYIGTLDNGRIFDQRDEEHPLSLTLGAEEVFPALERAIIGMAVGEVKNIHLSAEQAYGRRLDENLLRVSRELFPAEKDSRSIRNWYWTEFPTIRTEDHADRRVDDQEVLLDGNHDLAGCDLTFALQLVAIA